MDSARQTILIVDDESDLCEAIALDFRKEGYAVLEAVDGLDGFKKFQSNRVDLVLADYRMPQCDGATLLKMIKKESPDLPVIIFVTGPSDITVEEAYNSGAEALFMKPFDRKALKTAVRDALAPKEQFQARRSSQRQEVSMSISVAFPGAKKKNTVHQLLNIGRGGMFIGLKGGRPPKVGENVAFHLDAPEGRPVQVQGTGIVRWVRPKPADAGPAGFGMEFQGFDGNSRAAFLELINSIKTSTK